jgi:hypothetical protein
MDFSNGISTPQQMQFAQQIIKQFGTTIKQLIYTPLGYGISDGKIVPLSHWGDQVNSEHYNHVHVAFEGGGLVGKKVKSIQSRASYDATGETTILIQPIIIEKKVPVPMNTSKALSFPGSGSVNISSNKSQLTIR